MKAKADGLIALSSPEAQIIGSGDAGLVTFRLRNVLADLDKTRYIEFSGDLFEIQHTFDVGDADGSRHSMINALKVSAPAASRLL
jgi:hypothetical protein